MGISSVSARVVILNRSRVTRSPFRGAGADIPHLLCGEARQRDLQLRGFYRIENTLSIKAEPARF